MQSTHVAVTVPTMDNKRAQNKLDLRSPGWLGKRPIVGLIMVLIGSALFGAMALVVQNHSPLLQVDSQIANNLHWTALHNLPIVITLMIFGYYLGQEIIVAIGVLLVLYFLVKHYWTELWMVLIAWGGEAVIWLLVSNYFNRTRPPFAVEVWHKMTAPSFPSGHVFGAVLCYGLLAYFLVPQMKTRFWKIVAIAAAVAIILYIGFSRVFIGDHYPSDILGGYGLGLAWGGFVYTLVEVISRKIRDRQVI